MQAVIKSDIFHVKYTNTGLNRMGLKSISLQNSVFDNHN
jgi:hypothetical protein